MATAFNMTMPYNPPYSLYFGAERTFDVERYKRWFRDNWQLSFYFISAYLVLLFFGQKVMKRREPFELRRYLVAWNIALCAFSTLGTVRLLPELLYVLQNFGFVHSICVASQVNFPLTAFWSTLFLFSKVVELIDTAFIVLRKQKLIFLHWFHHSSTIFSSWYTASRPMGVVRWYMVMNFTVHTVMYCYFAARSSKIAVPKFIAMSITYMQLFQMVLGFVLTVWAYYAHVFYRECQVTESRIYVVLVTYSVDFMLFLNFFYRTYIVRPTRHQKTN